MYLWYLFYGSHMHIPAAAPQQPTTAPPPVGPQGPQNVNCDAYLSHVEVPEAARPHGAVVGRCGLRARVRGCSGMCVCKCM